MEENDVDLGAADGFAQFPAKIKLDRTPYFLLKGSEGYRLVLRFCPHAGAQVDCEDGELVCPMHGWTFDAETGACENVPSQALMAYAVEERDGRLIARMGETL